jgi:hypothetical protein
MKKNMLCLLASVPLLFSCQDQVASDPVSALNGLVEKEGYIGFQNPMKYTNTGTLVGGRPDSLAFVAPSSDCFDDDTYTRVKDESNFNKTYSYTFNGKLNLFTYGQTAISGSLKLSKEHTTVVSLKGLTHEYLSSIQVAEGYESIMSSTCKNFLDRFPFIIQALQSNKLSIAIYDRTGLEVQLDETNINEYLTISGDANWEIINGYRVELNSPTYIGYQLGKLTKSDDGMSLWRAMSLKEGNFFYEPIYHFGGEGSGAESFLGLDEIFTSSELKLASESEKYSIFRD